MPNCGPQVIVSAFVTFPHEIDCAANFAFSSKPLLVNSDFLIAGWADQLYVIGLQIGPASIGPIELRQAIWHDGHGEPRARQPCVMSPVLMSTRGKSGLVIPSSELDLPDAESSQLRVWSEEEMVGRFRTSIPRVWNISDEIVQDPVSFFAITLDVYYIAQD